MLLASIFADNLKLKKDWDPDRNGGATHRPTARE